MLIIIITVIYSRKNKNMQDTSIGCLLNDTNKCPSGILGACRLNDQTVGANTMFRQVDSSLR